MIRFRLLPVALLAIGLAASNGVKSADEPITITIEGVDELSAETVAAINRLASVLEAIKDAGIELDQAELDRLNRLFEQLTDLMGASADAAPRLNDALLQSRETLAQIARDAATEVNAAVVEPSLNRVGEFTQNLEAAASKARTTAMIAGLVLILLLAGVLLWLGRYLTRLMQHVREISDSYVLVPRSEWESRSGEGSAGRFSRSSHKSR